MPVMRTLLESTPTVGWIGYTGALVAVVALLRLAFKGLRFLVMLLMKANEALDDWRGEPARPGYAARPGIAERVAAMEAQLKTNGGTSLKDQTNRIEQKLNDHILASGDRDQREHHA